MKEISTQFDFDGIMIDVKFKDIRTLRLVIRRDGTPALSVPRSMSQDKVINFLKEHRQWIITRQAEAQERYEQEKRTTIHEYEEDEIFYFMGKPLTLKLMSKNGTPNVTHTANHIVVSSQSALSKNQIQRLISAWYIKQTKEIITTLVSLWLDRMHEVPVQEIRFRNMTSRWGSCAPQRRILCFNTKLIFKPLECIEEVVVHELCHLKEASHNARFHTLMSYYLPDYRERNKRLNS